MCINFQIQFFFGILNVEQCFALFTDDSFCLYFVINVNNNYLLIITIND